MSRRVGAPREVADDDRQRKAEGTSRPSAGEALDPAGNAAVGSLLHSDDRPVSRQQATALQRLAGNTRASVVIQRKGGGGPAGVGTLALDGLPPTPVLTASWAATLGVVKDQVGPERFPPIHPTAVTSTPMRLTVPTGPGADALAGWAQTSVAGGESRRGTAKAGVLALTRAGGKGGAGRAVEAGTLSFDDAEIHSYRNADAAVHVEIGIGSFRLEGADTRPRAKTGLHLAFADRALGNVPVLSATGGELKTETVSAPGRLPGRPVSREIEPLRVTMPFDPSVSALTAALSSNQHRRLDFTLVGRGPAVDYSDALVTEVVVQPGADPTVQIAFTPENRRI